eukprot:6173001-Pleurochrysis_carterae.AAC.1
MARAASRRAQRTDPYVAYLSYIRSVLTVARESGVYSVYIYAARAPRGRGSSPRLGHPYKQSSLA